MPGLGSGQRNSASFEVGLDAKKMPTVCWRAFDVFIQNLTALHLKK
jgi:hypothetical protein